MTKALLRAAFAATTIAVLSTSPVRADYADEEACRVQRGPEALEACDRVIDSPKSNRDQIGSALISRGQQKYELKQYDEAKDDFARAMVLMPRYVQLAYGNRGNCFYAKGEYKIAIEHYTRAIEIDANYASAYAARGQLWEKAGEYKKARADYKLALESDANFSDTKWAHETARDGLKRLIAKKPPADNDKLSKADPKPEPKPEANKAEPKGEAKDKAETKDKAEKEKSVEGDKKL